MRRAIDDRLKLTVLVSGIRELIAGLPQKPEKRTMVGWAADCAEHVLPRFELRYPDDDRPRKAIEACREWLDNGVFRMSHVRGRSLAAHAAAREAADETARAAARAAGQAIAATHVPDHAIASAAYALRAAAAGSGDIGRSVAREKRWQSHRLLSLMGEASEQ